MKGYNSDCKSLVLNFTKVRSQTLKSRLCDQLPLRDINPPPPQLLSHTPHQGSEFNEFAEGKIGYLKVQQSSRGAL